jgi:hypothetical protein
LSQLVGNWVAGDSGKTLTYAVTQNGVALDLTGATNIVLSLVRRASGSDVSVVIPGAIADAAGGILQWAGTSAVGLYVPQPASRLATDVYEARVSFTLSSGTYWTDLFRVGVNNWGLSTTPTSVTELDPTMSLQDEIDALGPSGGTILLRNGTYYGASGSSSPLDPLVISSFVTLIGEARDGVVIASPISIQGINNGLRRMHVNPIGADYGVKIYNGGAFLARNWMDHVWIGGNDQGSAAAGNAPRDGLVLDGAGVFLAQRVTMAFNRRHGLSADQTGAQPNTTLKFDTCSFVANGFGPTEVTGNGIDLQASLSIAEFDGGNSEGNKFAEFNASNMNNIRLRDFDFETSEVMAAQALFGGCNPILVDNCNFFTASGKATRALSFATCVGVRVLPNRYSGWTNVGIVRLDENCTNCWVDPMQINTGNCWVEDYSR